MNAQLDTDTIPPPGRVGRNASGEALCVSVRWGDRRLATHVLGPGLRARLALGPGADADVVVPRSGRAWFEHRDGQCALVFTDGVKGEVLRNGEQPLSFSDLVGCGLADERDGQWTMRLGRRDEVRVDAGALTVEAFRVRAPKRVGAGLDDVVDYRWLNVLLVCLLLGALAIAQASFAEGDDLDSDALDGRAMTQLRRVLVKSEPPPKKAAAALKEDARPEKATPAPEGRPMREPRPLRGGVKNAPPRPDARALVGLALAGAGTQGVFAAGGLGRDLTGALGTLVGSSDGLGGLGLRGNGGGALGGELVGLGGVRRLGTPGIGRGEWSLCRGPKCKASEVPPEWGSVDHVCSADGAQPCMDKELIRKVIREHVGQVRFCYESLLTQYPALSGKVSVSFHVSGTGGVDAARVVSSSAQRAELGDCLVSRVRTWSFPTNRSQGGYTVTYPFVFRPSGS